MDPNALVHLIGAAVGAANALAGWLLTYALHSTILIGAILLVTSTSVGRRLAAAHGTWLWRFALVGAIASASLQSVRAAAPLAGTVRLDRGTPAPARVHVEVMRHGVTGTAPAPATRAGSWSGRSPARVITASMIDVKPGWTLFGLGAWVAGAAILLGWYLFARARFLHRIGPRRDGSNTLAGRSLRHLQRANGLVPVRLTLAERLTSPVALGGREICLPSRALSDLDPIRLEGILAHELAHVERRDPAWLTVARVIEAVFFFQPLNRVVRRRLQEAAEFASDAWASRRIARPLDLAHCLARVAEWTVATSRMPVPAMAERRGAVLVRRVERLAKGLALPEAAPGKRVRLAAAAALLAMVLVAPRGAVGVEPGTGAAALVSAVGAGGFGPSTGPLAGRRGAVFMRRTVDGSGPRVAETEVFVLRVAVDSTG